MAEPHPEPTTNRQNTSATAMGRPSSSTEAQTQIVPTTMLDAVQLDSERGKTVIADSVVAKIAGAAAREIEGVHDLVPLGTGATIAGIAGRITRNDQRSTGVNVEVGHRVQ